MQNRQRSFSSKRSATKKCNNSDRLFLRPYYHQNKTKGRITNHSKAYLKAVRKIILNLTGYSSEFETAFNPLNKSYN